MRPYFPGGELIIFTTTPRIHEEYATSSSQRLRLGLLGSLVARWHLLSFAAVVPGDHKQPMISPIHQAISNPDRSPSFRPSPSEPFSSDAFATGGPLGIIAFYRSPQNTSDASRSQARPYSGHVVLLSRTISPRTHQAGYERLRPNNRECRLGRWGYRGGWHQSYPPLILQASYTWQKPMQSMSTLSGLITLARSVKFSRLLHPIGLGSVSQYPSGGSLFQGPYRSLVW